MRFRGAPTAVAQYEGGFVFRATVSRVTWSLGIGYKCQLFTDGKLLINAGYHLGRSLGSMSLLGAGDPELWRDGGEVINGTPSAIELVDRLGTGFHENMPRVLDTFAGFIEGGR